MAKPVYDYEFSKRDYNKRKNLLLFLASFCDQFLFEANKLTPVAEKFSKMGENERRRYSESVTAIAVWLESMRELAYGDADPKDYSYISDVGLSSDEANGSDDKN